MLFPEQIGLADASHDLVGDDTVGRQQDDRGPPRASRRNNCRKPSADPFKVRAQPSPRPLSAVGEK
jgi:hypothetical protein